MAEHKHWHSRGYLPHFDAARAIQSITFRLADSIPKQKLLELENALARMSRDDQREAFEALLDLGHGDCVLQDPRCAEAVENALLAHDGIRYKLLSWVVMPNHVHVIAEIMPGHPMGKTIQGWKGSSAFAINRILGRSGTLWLPDYFDRFIRDATHYDNTLLYIEFNPVKAGLATEPQLWPFSSAHRRVR